MIWNTDHIVGAHLVGHAGEELINLFAFDLMHGITARQMQDAIYAYPTFSADIKSMFYVTAGTASRNARASDCAGALRI